MKNNSNSFDKESIPVCNILGVNIAAIDMKWLLDFTIKFIEELSGNYICVSNVHTTVMSMEDADYCNIQNGGVLVMPDGGPLSTLGRKRGYANMCRITGPDYMLEIFKLSKQYGYRHYFYGSTEETLQKMMDKIEREYPYLNVVGMYSPPFREQTEEEDEAIIKIINDAEPDFIWVGLGAPKQEIWMANHKNKVIGLMVGVGAGFDFFVGNIFRAPKWMQNNNLEWLYRLVQEPCRLFKRYFYTNIKFIWNAVIRGK